MEDILFKLSRVDIYEELTWESVGHATIEIYLPYRTTISYHL